MRLIYVSDLHLRAEDDETGRRFLNFLREVPRKGDSLVLGGDIFDLMVGAKSTYLRKYPRFFERLSQLVRGGTIVYYLEGNHDFHLQGLLPPEVHLKTDDFSLDWNGKKIWITHGDMIDPEDRGYRLLRKVTRSLLFKLLLKCVPGFVVDAIGAWSSRQSRKYHDVFEIGERRGRRLRELFFAFSSDRIAQGSDFVLAGHSHLPDQKQIDSGGRRGEYVNLGFSNRFLPFASLTEGANSFVIDHYL